MTLINGNGRNGLFLKVLVGTLTVGLVAAAGGLVKVYRDVGVLQDTQKLDAAVEIRLARIERDIAEVTALAQSINEDRHKRSIIIPQMQADIAELKRLMGRR